MTRARSLKIARWFLVILLSPALLYWLAGNLFLRFGLPLAFRSTNTVNATLGSAWTLWPGVVHARGVRIVFQDHNLQWSLDIEEAKLRLRLRELLSMTFHATEVTGSGAAFKMRHRIDPWSKNEPWVATLPPIPEFPAPAVFEARVPEAPVSDADYALWTVHLENVDVGVREVWVQFVRYLDERGRGRARGAFRLKPARTLWVGPASLTLDSGRVTLGKEALAQSLSGKITCTVHPFDVRVPDGREVLRFITTDLQLDARDATLDPVLRQFFADSGLALATTPGPLTISARLRRGKLSEDSSVRLESARLRAEYRDFRLDARQATALLATRAGERADLSLAIATAELSPPNTRAQPARLRDTLAVNTSSGLDTAGEMTQIERTLRLGHVDVADAKMLNAFSRAAPFRAGAVALELEAKQRGEVLEATTRAQVKKLLVKNGDTEARLDGKLLAKLSDARQDQGSGRLTLEARLSPSLAFLSAHEPELSLDGSQDLRVTSDMRRNARGDVKGQFHVEGSKLSLLRNERGERHEVARLTKFRLGGKVNRTASGVLDATVRAESPRLHALFGNTWLRARSNIALELSRFRENGDSGNVRSEIVLSDGVAVSEGGSDCPWGTVPNAKVRFAVDFTRERASGTAAAELSRARLSWGDFQARGLVNVSAQVNAWDRKRELGSVAFRAQAKEFALQSGAGERAGWEARAPNLTVSGALTSGEQVSGLMTVSAVGASSRIGLTRMQTDFNASTKLSSVDFARREARFSGDFKLSNARLSTGDEHVDGWWANIRADSALVIARDNVDLSVPFRANLRDGQPAMAILAASGSLPGFVADALPLRQIAVTGTVQRRCRLTNFRFTEATGGPLVARGILNSTSETLRAAFLVRLDALRLVSAGVRIDPKDSGVSLFAGDDWLRERSEALDEVIKSTLAAPCPTPPSECSSDDDSN